MGALKPLVFVILIAFLFPSCKSKNEQTILLNNNIQELNYLKLYNNVSQNDSNFSIQKFNFLFKSLSLYRLKDSSLVFISYQKEPFLILFKLDTLQIYRKEYDITPENSEWYNIQKLYFGIRGLIESGRFDSIPMLIGPKYSNYYESKHWPADGILYKSIWKSRDKNFFIHYKYEYCTASLCRFKYEKNIYNSLISYEKLNKIAD